VLPHLGRVKHSLFGMHSRTFTFRHAKPKSECFKPDWGPPLLNIGTFQWERPIYHHVYCSMYFGKLHCVPLTSRMRQKGGLPGPTPLVPDSESLAAQAAYIEALREEEGA
jgi:hypothetical protein